jgi:F-type H+-transporting ATPase subunit delta
LFETARSAGLLEKVQEDFNSLIALLDKSAELSSVLLNPALAATKKQALITELQQRLQLDEHFFHFLLVVAHKGRLTLIREIFTSLREQVDEFQGVVKVDALTAVDLDTKLRERLTARLSELTGREVQLSVRTEPSLLGGLVLRVGNRVVDASLRGQLRRLRTELAAAG